MTSLIDSPNVTDSCDGLYQTFRALDFLSPVVGALFDRSRTATQGMPLGGIGTGCLDIAPNGTLGFATIFNSHVPRRGPINLPFVGVFAGEKLWVLSTQRFHRVRRTGAALVSHQRPGALCRRHRVLGPLPHGGYGLPDRCSVGYEASCLVSLRTWRYRVLEYSDRSIRPDA